jgi:hypothetical protein
MLIDRSTRTGSGEGASIYPASLAIRLDHAEVRTEVEYDLMKMSHILSS